MHELSCISSHNCTHVCLAVVQCVKMLLWEWALRKTEISQYEFKPDRVWVDNRKGYSPPPCIPPKFSAAFQFRTKTFITIPVIEFKDGKHLLGYLACPLRASIEDYFDSIFDFLSSVFSSWSIFILKCLCWWGFSFFFPWGKYIYLDFFAFLQYSDMFCRLQKLLFACNQVQAGDLSFFIGLVMWLWITAFRAT